MGTYNQDVYSLVRKSLILLAVISIFGCGSKDPNFSLLADSDEFIQTNDGSANNKVDILFVINDQPSMSSFQDELASSFSTFMQIFQTKGFDFKIAVVTTSGYLADPTLNGYTAVNEAEADFNDSDGLVFSGFPVLLPSTPDLFGNFTINSHPDKNTSGQDGRSFSSFRQALVNTRPTNLNFHRSDAFLAVIIVDNQDDFSGNGRCKGCNINQRYNAPTLDAVDTYVQFLDTYTASTATNRKYNVSAMTQIASPCQGGTNMVRIMDLATQTDGVLGDICAADFGASMVDISSNIATQSTKFYLDRVPVADTITVEVDGVAVVEDLVNGWSYNADSNTIQFNGSSVPQTGAVIRVDFDPMFYGG